MVFPDPTYLAPVGSTALLNDSGVDTYKDLGAPVDGLAVQFVVEAVGAAPAVTFKVVASHDAENWYDMAYVTDATDTVAVTAITLDPAVAADASILFLSNPVARQYRYWALVVSSVNNVTFHATIHPYF